MTTLSEDATFVNNGAEAIAHRLTDRPTKSGDNWYAPCPAHGGEHNKLSLKDADGGRLLLKCWSSDCTFKQIMAALREKGYITGTFTRTWTYPDKSLSTRRDNPPRKKRFDSPGDRRSPLFILGDDGACPISIVEGEGKVDELHHMLQADEGLAFPKLAVATYKGGANSAHLADYSAVKGRVVFSWPDPDKAGQVGAKNVEAGARGAGCSLFLAVPVGTPAIDDMDFVDRQAALQELLVRMEEGLNEPETLRIPRLGYTMEELAALPDPVHLIGDMLSVQDVSILAGKPKTGKTFLIVGMLAENYNRCTWLGNRIPELRCLVLGEEPAARFARRMKEADVKTALPASRFLYYSLDRLRGYETWAEKVNFLQTYINDQPEEERPNLVVIDTVGFWTGMSDLNDYATVSKEFRPLVDFAITCKIAILLVHHGRKGVGETIDDVSGSNAISANCASVMLLTKDKNNEETGRVLKIWSRDSGETEVALEYNRDTHFYFTPTPLDRLSEEDRDILNALSNHPEGVMVTTLAEDLEGASRDKIRNALNRMLKVGLVRKEGGSKGRAQTWYPV